MIPREEPRRNKRDVFGDHAVSCKKSGFGDRHLGTNLSLPGPYIVPSSA